jgi:hypothetical protein
MANVSWPAGPALGDGAGVGLAAALGDGAAAGLGEAEAAGLGEADGLADGVGDGAADGVGEAPPPTRLTARAAGELAPTSRTGLGPSLKIRTSSGALAPAG